MLWITRSHFHVDRVACPWLITRFVDSKAEFLFVPKNWIEQAAQETGGIPYPQSQFYRSVPLRAAAKELSIDQANTTYRHDSNNNPSKSLAFHVP